MDTSGNVIFDYEVTGSAVASISTGEILNGDIDGWYTIIYRGIGNGQQAQLRLNNDGGANYGVLGVSASNTTVGSSAGTGLGFMQAGTQTSGYSTLATLVVSAKSGAVRLYNYNWFTEINGTTVGAGYVGGGVWNNTADNITRIDFVSASGSAYGVGTRVIILKGNALTVGNSPGVAGAWRRVGSSVLGSDAASVTFSGLDGNTAVCYYISMQVKADATAGGTGIIKILPDNNTGNVYGYQRLTGTNTTVAAARATPSCLYGGATGTASYYSMSNTLIFAKQGFVRTCITENSQDVTGTTNTAVWLIGQSYNVTNTNIASLVIAATTNNFLAGSQFDLYALYV